MTRLLSATAAAFAAGLALVPAAALAAAGGLAPIPLAAGRYCGPDSASFTVDPAADTVVIDGLTCLHPVIGADRLQSDACRDASGTPMTHTSFPFRVVGRNVLRAGHWFTPCAAGG